MNGTDPLAKTETEFLVKGIRDTIQRVYGDATQTVLDERAAREIWKYLLSVGVAPASGVAMIVAAAGGRVTVTDELLLDPPAEYTVMDDGHFGKVLRTPAKAAVTRPSEAT